MKMKALTLATLMSISAVPAMAQSGELPGGPHVVTSGQATVDAKPDMATLSIVVNVSAKEASEAKKQADERVAQYFDFLKEKSIKKENIEAANLLTQPEYDYTKDGKSVLKGYRAVRRVQVTLHQLDKLNELLDGALKKGLNEIRSVDLGVANPESYKIKARDEAIKHATQQAKQLAEGFNATLGSVYSIRYHVAHYQPMPMTRMYKAAAADTSAQQTYEQESIHFDDQVDVVFEIKPKMP